MKFIGQQDVFRIRIQNLSDCIALLQSCSNRCTHSWSYLHIDYNPLSFRLRENQLKVKFVTNTTKESKRLLLERLTKIGFDINSDEIFTSLSAARKLMDAKRLSPLMLIDDRALEEFKGKLLICLAQG